MLQLCSPFLPLLPLLSSLLPLPLPLPPLLRYPTVLGALSLALATTVAANFATAVALMSSHRHRIALALPHIPRYCPCSCHRRVTPALAAVVAAALPPPWPLLPLSLLPLLPHNPHPCRHQHCDTPLLPPPCPCSSRPRCHPCRHRIAPTLADAAFEADLLVDIVMFLQPLTLLPLVALSCCH